MGRYYSGDIEGKFWFGVQSSKAADRFGVRGESSYISYYFDEENKEEVEEELKRLEESLGDQLKLIEDFFANQSSYTASELADNGINVECLSDYADYLLGKQILDCINENGCCSFDAEL
jgi:hypothetical protein